MKVLCVSGFTQTIGNGNGFWQLADMIQAAGHTVIRAQWDTLTTEQCEGVDAAIVYSYGMASYWHLTKQRNILRAARVYIIAGVPRFWFGQLYGGCWHMPPEVKRAIAFNTSQAVVPECAGILNADFSRINTDLDGVDHGGIQSDPRVHSRILSELGTFYTGERVTEGAGTDADSSDVQRVTD